jgi:hypothetical protein
MQGKLLKLVALIVVGGMVTGCTDETGDDADGHLLEAQQQALERARNVEDEVAAAAEQRRRQIDDAENDN